MADPAGAGPRGGAFGNVCHRRRRDRGVGLPCDGLAEGGAQFLIIGPGRPILAAVVAHCWITLPGDGLAESGAQFLIVGPGRPILGAVLAHRSITSRSSASPRDTRLFTVPGRTPMVSAISRSERPA